MTLELTATQTRSLQNCLANQYVEFEAIKNEAARDLRVARQTTFATPERREEKIQYHLNLYREAKAEMLNVSAILQKM